MLYYARGSVSTVFTPADLRAGLHEALAKLGARKRVLAIPPDFTRFHSRAGELTRYDIEVFPTAALLAPGHRLRLTVTTYDFPHLVPTRPQRSALAGGTYRISQGGVHASHLVVPLADPATFAAEEEKLRRLTAATGAKLGAAVSCYCNSTVGFGRI